eukprot:2544201-Rhodomonas_salina.3
MDLDTEDRRSAWVDLGQSLSDQNRSIPAPRWAAACAGGAGWFFLFGGNGATSTSGMDALHDLHVYDPVELVWVELVSTPGKAWPSPRVGAAMVVLGQSVYLFGGNDAAGMVSDTLLAFDLAGGAWRDLSDVQGGPQGRTTSGLASGRGRLFLYGGCTEQAGSIIAQNDLYEFWPDSDEWKQLYEPMVSGPQPICGQALAFTGGKLHIWGVE